MGMRIRILMALTAAVVVTTSSPAQGTAAKPPAKKAATGKAKSLVQTLADTALTSAASLATDTLLGDKAGMVAAVLGADGAPSCPAGLMAMPAQYLTGGGAAGGMPGMPSAGSMIVGAAKSKLTGKAGAAAGVAGAVAGAGGAAQPAAAAQGQYVCGTPEQISASVQAAQAAQQGGGVAGAASAAAGMSGALKYTPVGAAIAAAPLAGGAAKKLGGMFSKGQSAESMKKDLGKGRLVVQKVKFVAGSDELGSGFEEELTKVAQALANSEGQFALRVMAEAEDDADAAAALANRRAARVYAHLLLAGIPSDRLTRDEGASGKPAKKGEARIEIVTAAPDSGQ